MHLTEAILLGLALAMDCFTVSLTSGTIAKRVVARPMLAMTVLFGLFQGGMVAGGWFVSSLFSRILEPIDHWIAFGLLAFIGVQMIREGFRKEEECASRHGELRPDPGRSKMYPLRELCADLRGTSGNRCDGFYGAGRDDGG